MTYRLCVSCHCCRVGEKIGFSFQNSLSSRLQLVGHQCFEQIRNNWCYYILSSSLVWRAAAGRSNQYNRDANHSFLSGKTKSNRRHFEWVCFLCVANNNPGKTTEGCHSYLCWRPWTTLIHTNLLVVLALHPALASSSDRRGDYWGDIANNTYLVFRHTPPPPLSSYLTRTKT